mmetsp:Transcript_116886/g.261104  ORF Transcript_116886/g.261104 Transcript_116886/m.261104 type:complete len:260 (+) Transcript_116886:134-913(+)
MCLPLLQRRRSVTVDIEGARDPIVCGPVEPFFRHLSRFHLTEDIDLVHRALGKDGLQHPPSTHGYPMQIHYQDKVEPVRIDRTEIVREILIGVGIQEAARLQLVQVGDQRDLPIRLDELGSRLEREEELPHDLPQVRSHTPGTSIDGRSPMHVPADHTHVHDYLATHGLKHLALPQSTIDCLGKHRRGRICVAQCGSHEALHRLVVSPLFELGESLRQQRSHLLIHAGFYAFPPNRLHPLADLCDFLFERLLWCGTLRR